MAGLKLLPLQWHRVAGGGRRPNRRRTAFVVATIVGLMLAAVAPAARADVAVADGASPDVLTPDVWTGARIVGLGYHHAELVHLWGRAADSDGDAVLFDDTAAPNGSVTVGETVQPSAIVVNNDSLPYVFSGAGASAVQRLW